MMRNLSRDRSIRGGRIRSFTLIDTYSPTGEPIKGFINEYHHKAIGARLLRCQRFKEQRIYSHKNTDFLSCFEKRYHLQDTLYPGNGFGHTSIFHGALAEIGIEKAQMDHQRLHRPYTEDSDDPCPF